MDVLTAIKTRRSVGRVRPDAPPRELIARVLEAAVWAPNHRLTEPWRFFVLAGEAREGLGEAMAQGLAATLDPALPEAKASQILTNAHDKALRAPVIIAVAVEPDPKSIESEEVAAGAAAVQNLLLAAHSLGLGAIWRTGGPANDPVVKAFFGLAPSAHLIGFVYLGWPDGPIPTKTRQPAAVNTQWLGWEDDPAS
jgi:nitroreductase